MITSSLACFLIREVALCLSSFLLRLAMQQRFSCLARAQPLRGDHVTDN